MSALVPITSSAHPAHARHRCGDCGRVVVRAVSFCGGCGATDSYRPLATPSPSPSFPSVTDLGPSGQVNPFRRASAFSVEPAAVAIPLASVKREKVSRLSTGDYGVDLVFGASEDPGIALGTLIELAGDSGAGKSTLLLQIAGHVAKTDSVLFVEAEEGDTTIAARAERLKLFSTPAVSDNLLILSCRDVDEIVRVILLQRPRLVIVNSLQMMRSHVCQAAPKSAKLLTYVAETLFTLVHELGNMVLFFVSHITKDGDPSGPKAIEHATDANAYLAKDSHQTRILAVAKNRTGWESRTARYIMSDTGEGLLRAPDPTPADPHKGAPRESDTRPKSCDNGGPL